MSNPSASDKSRYAKLIDLGCIACAKRGRYTEPTIHHIRDGSAYKDNQKTIPLCTRHHMYQHAVNGVVNREKNPAEFRIMFGSDAELLAEVNKLIRE